MWNVCIALAWKGQLTLAMLQKINLAEIKTFRSPHLEVIYFSLSLFCSVILWKKKLFVSKNFFKRHFSSNIKSLKHQRIGESIHLPRNLDFNSFNSWCSLKLGDPFHLIRKQYTRFSTVKINASTLAAIFPSLYNQKRVPANIALSTGSRHSTYPNRCRQPKIRQ